MSHFTRVKTQFKNRACLIKALEDMGYKGKVEVHDKAVNLYGYQGDKREQVANIILRRKYVGGSSNDIGFVLREDGSYEAIISEFDSTKHNKAWVGKLTQRYSLHTVKDQAKKLGYHVATETVDSNGEIYLTVETGF
jgi:hypothetical protein